MEIEEIIDKLESTQETFPSQAIKEAAAKKEEITPKLLYILKRDKNNIQYLQEEPKYMAHIYAMFLLAQFREKKAYPLIVDFFSIPGEISIEVTGEVVTEYLCRILASVSNGELGLMKSLVENEKADEYVRCAALRGMLTLVAQNILSRQEVLDYFKTLFREKLPRKDSYVWNCLVDSSTCLYPEEVLEDIEKTVEDGLVEKGSIILDWVKGRLSLGEDRVMEKLEMNRRYTFIDDPVREMEWWACFDNSKSRRVEKKLGLKREPVVKEEEPGRNDPCPCGSGKKYKYCCGS